ncbi:sigma 54-interacting transcriptional regulator [Vagococcus sp. BWB3-3]|uniref:Sigma 54-interacting transcriptional regulator n=1 Tax=Vagococcus allomyrinae TaxID=2794353 RepID=A0A940SYT4_9ENTE|nr:sigma 54-interacting transcriptional regulator [Vagococcus allomyrinae]MBP1043723.1 sigma 54-interacting transcriptional regulator [Vagococcus allomyrinae]
MKRIDLILMEMTKLYSGKGLSTMAIAEQINLSRANVSNDLNELVKMGLARKESGKPVLYHPVIKQSKLEQFERDNPSLQMIVKQAKAAILYPPKGLNMLIYGETGVGKSMLASLIYDYAQHVKPEERLPFVQFNCADYANNPQLLVGQLFGISKNAYTGAEEEKKGLIEKADGGILFLDEIHRLPPEGQEIFFTFLDRGVYHRLGESDTERQASVLIIAATTEASNSALLNTFQRRIPMILMLPNLKERTSEERAALISLFFQQEANRLNETIKITKNSLRAFLNYECSHNIGQLKNDIQLTCAKAYADFLVMSHKEIVIHSPELPSYILTGLYSASEKKDDILTSQLAGKYIAFEPDCEDNCHQSALNIYKLIHSNETIHQEETLGYDEIQEILRTNFDTFFPPQNEHSHSMDNLKIMMSEPLYKICIETIALAENLLQRPINNKLKQSMAIHISTIYHRIKRGDLPKRHHDADELATLYPHYFSIATECLLFLNAALDIDVPQEEVAFLTMFFIYNDQNEHQKDELVRVFVVSHGASSATSMATFVNDLLGTQHAVGINMDLSESPSIIIDQIKEMIVKSHSTSDILFLVDMGSLINLGTEIEKTFQITCRTFDMSSTIHVLEATRKAIIGTPLDDIFQDLLSIRSSNHPTNAQSQFPVIPEEDKISVILSFCLTGEGTAVIMKNLLKQKLTNLPDSIKIITITLLRDESISSYIKHMQNQYHILCVVTTVPIEIALPQFQLYDLFNNKVIQQIQYFIELDTTYREIELTLKDELKNIDSFVIVADAKKFIKRIENVFGINFNIKVIFGAIFHISCLIDRLKGDYDSIEFPDSQSYKQKYSKEFSLISSLLTTFERDYAISIPENEVLYLISIFFGELQEE